MSECLSTGARRSATRHSPNRVRTRIRTRATSSVHGLWARGLSMGARGLSREPTMSRARTREEHHRAPGRERRGAQRGTRPGRGVGDAGHRVRVARDGRSGIAQLSARINAVAIRLRRLRPRFELGVSGRNRRISPRVSATAPVRAEVGPPDRAPGPLPVVLRRRHQLRGDGLLRKGAVRCPVQSRCAITISCADAADV